MTLPQLRCVIAAPTKQLEIGGKRAGVAIPGVQLKQYEARQRGHLRRF